MRRLVTATGRVAMLMAVVAAASLATACTDITPPWELAHDRIVAVRATPPHIPAGGRASLDVLVTTDGGGPAVVVPQMVALAEQGTGISGVIVEPDGDAGAGGWSVVAPDEAALDQARAALALAADEPVPVRIAVTVELAGQTLDAIKTVYLGSERDNPPLGMVTIGGEPAEDGMVVPTAADVDLQVAAADTDVIDWLTSVGDLTDPSDTIATLRADEPADGHVAVVVRDGEGGVTWGWWTLRASP